MLRSTPRTPPTLRSRRASRIAPMLACALVCTAAGARAGQAPFGDNDAWLEAVRSHVPGRGDPPLAAVAAMSAEQIEKSLRRFADAEVPLLARALVLHTDVAILERSEAEAGGNGGQGRAFVITDGRNTGRKGHSRHWNYALGIADRLARRPTVGAKVPLGTLVPRRQRAPSALGRVRAPPRLRQQRALPLAGGRALPPLSRHAPPDLRRPPDPAVPRRRV